VVERWSLQSCKFIKGIGYNINYLLLLKRGSVMIKYYFVLAVIAGSAAVYGVANDVGANAAAAGSLSVDNTAVGTDTDTEKFTEEISREQVYRAPSQTHTPPDADPAAAESTARAIPTIILPNNVCIINTDISPDRTIEEHIIACIRAQRIRQSLTQ